YVLLPVTDGDKHYWVSEDEISKLVDGAGEWLAGHPERDLIVRRYLRHQRPLVHTALDRLAGEELGTAQLLAADGDDPGAKEADSGTPPGTAPDATAPAGAEQEGTAPAGAEQDSAEQDSAEQAGDP